MRTPFKSKLQHALFATLAIGSIVAAAGAGPSYADGPVVTQTGGAPTAGDVPTVPQPAVGSDLTEFDTPSAKFTQLANGLIGVQLYAARVGINDPSGWRFRNPQLGTVGADGTVAPLDEPFGLHIATNAGSPSLATLTDEDKVSLSVSGVTLNGIPLATGTGVLSPTAVQFTGGTPVGTAANLAVTSTISGFSLQVQLQQPPQAGALGVQLNPDQRLALVSRPDGTIVAQSSETRYADDGVSGYKSDSPHFIISTPLIEDAAGVAAPAPSGGASSLQVANGPNGKPSLTLGVDPTWLANPARVYPVHITLRVDTALSVLDAGRTSSTTACGGAAAQGSDMLRAGTSAGCTSIGHVYFDTSQIPPRTNIQRATVQLAPVGPLPTSGIQAQDEQSGATATALSGGAAAAQPQGNAASAPGVTQSSGLNLDATAIVLQWVQHSSPNQGIRLSSTGPQLQLTSLEEARTSPQFMPALSLVINPNPIPRATESGPGNINAPAVAGVGDGASFIYGAAGAFGECGQTDGHVCLDITTALAAVQGHPGNYCQQGGTICNGFGGGLIRFAAYLPCDGVNANWSAAWALMRQAYSRQLIPIVNFVAPQGNPSGNCQNAPVVTGPQWYALMQGFAQGAPALPKVYFEIGNEEDYYNYYGDYNQVFFDASAGLYWNLPAGSFPWYRLLVGGLLKTKGLGCGANSLDNANAWVNYAYTNTYPGRPRPIRTVLRVALHTYGYTATDTQFYNSAAYNFIDPNNQYPVNAYNFQANACVAIDAVVKYANSVYEPSLNNLPLIITEINGTVARIPLNDTYDIQNESDLDGAYLTDLFSYLYDRCGFASLGCTTGPIVSANSPLRVMWNRGNDENEGGVRDALGIYSTNGSDKLVPALNRCPGQKTSPTGQSIAHTYYYLRNGNCW